MATWEDVRRLALALPEASEDAKRGVSSWRVREKMFAWERPLRASEVRALGDAAPDGPILGVPKRLAREYVEANLPSD